MYTCRNVCSFMLYGYANTHMQTQTHLCTTPSCTHKHNDVGLPQPAHLCRCGYLYIYRERYVSIYIYISICKQGCAYI